MNILIITAQPSSKGFVHTMASTYKKSALSSEKTAEIIDLYDKKYMLPFLQFEDIKKIKLSETAILLQKKIEKADEIIFIFPLWWGLMPAILKNFFDTVFSSGFAFKYVNGLPKGLLKNKKARVLITCDAPRWMYFFLGFPLKKALKTLILRFCGIQTISFDIWGKISFRSEKEKNDILKTVETLAHY